MSSPPKTIVFVVDDDASVLRALARLIRAAGFAVETFASPHAFLGRTLHEGPGCVVLDLEMPGSSGLDVQEAMVSAGRLSPVVFLTGHGTIPATVQAMKRGAVDFLTKPFEEEDLLDAIRRAISRSESLRAERGELQAVNARIASLTSREHEVFLLVVEGLPNKRIASRLGTAEKTIKVHRARIMDKMAAGSFADLVRMAERVGTPAGSREPT